MEAGPGWRGEAGNPEQAAPQLKQGLSGEDGAAPELAGLQPFTRLLPTQYPRRLWWAELRPQAHWLCRGRRGEGPAPGRRRCEWPASGSHSHQNHGEGGYKD